MSLIENRLDHFQEGSYAWFTGVVEDNLDPKELGRVRVRCFGYHTEDRTQIPTKDLPWAYVLTPVTNPALDTIGTSATGIMKGSWVVGFFRDGKSAQDPVVLGTLPSRTSNISSQIGFSDPEGILPKRVNTPDMPIEARTNYKKSGPRASRIDSRQEGIEMAIAPNVSTVDPSTGDEKRQTWSNYTPEDVQKVRYPYNKVTKTINGHLIEIDDSPGYRRLLTQHASGSFDEIIEDGSKTTTVKGARYTVVFKDDNIYVKGNCNLTVDGSVRTLVKGNYHLEVEGDYTENIKGNKRTKIGASQYVEVDYHYNRNIGRSHNDRIGTNSTIIVDKNMNLVVSGTYDETFSGAYSSTTNSSRDIISNSSSDELVLGNKDVTVMGNIKQSAAANYDQSSIGTTTIGSTGFLSIGTGSFMTLNVGTAMIKRVTGANIEFTGSNTLFAPSNTILGATSNIGQLSVMGNVSILGNTTALGFMTAANFISTTGRTLLTHVHAVPSSGGVSSPPIA